MKKALSSGTGPYSNIMASCFCILLAMVGSCGKKSSGGAINGNDPSNFVNYAGMFMKTDSTTTAANGTVTGSFNKVTSVLTYTITWHALTSTPIAMHFHDNGPVIITITGYPVATDQSMSATATFDETQATDLAGGRVFVMIHTVNYPGGEIMAPLVRK
jgi:hypothetical protein